MESVMGSDVPPMPRAIRCCIWPSWHPRNVPQASQRAWSGSPPPARLRTASFTASGKPVRLRDALACDGFRAAALSMSRTTVRKPVRRSRGLPGGRALRLIARPPRRTGRELRHKPRGPYRGRLYPQRMASLSCCGSGLRASVAPCGLVGLANAGTEGADDLGLGKEYPEPVLCRLADDRGLVGGELEGAALLVHPGRLLGDGEAAAGDLRGPSAQEGLAARPVALVPGVHLKVARLGECGLCAAQVADELAQSALNVERGQRLRRGPFAAAFLIRVTLSRGALPGLVTSGTVTPRSS